MQHWNAEDFETNFRNDAFHKHLSVIKHQLFEKIMDALHLYHRQHSLEEDVKKWIHQAYLLLKRAQNKPALRLHKKAGKAIETNKLWDLKPLFLSQQRHLIERNLLSINAQNWLLEYKHCIEVLQQRSAITALKTNITHQHIQKVNPDTSTVQKWKKQLEAKIIPDCPMTQTEYLQSKALLAFLQAQPEKARNTNADILAHFEQMSSRQRHVPERHLSTLYNYMIDQLQAGNEEELHKGLEKLKSLVRKKSFKHIPGIEAKVFEWRHQLLLNSFIQKRDYLTAFSMLNAIEKGLNKHQKKIKAPAVATLRFLCGLVAFHHENYDKALYFLTPLHLENRPVVVQDIYQFATFLYILCHYELGNHQFLEHLISRQKRKRKALHQSSDYADDFLYKIDQLTHWHPAKSKPVFFKEWHKALEKTSSPLHRYLDLGFWIQKQYLR